MDEEIDELIGLFNYGAVQPTSAKNASQVSHFNNIVNIIS